MKNYLVCIDSDGCAIDSMEIKHRRCFGPCMIDEFGLEAWRDELLDHWNQINLYSMTRGINRFLGLEILLREVDSTYLSIDGLDAYSAWCRQTSVFSNTAIEAMCGSHPVFSKVLAWSQAVNRSIEGISDEICPFDGVKEALHTMHACANIAIVSSANPQAVRDEWTRFGFMNCVDHVMAQDAGTKSDCIRKLLSLGYTCDHVLMIGDAPGDAKAAQENGVLYYPILAGNETASWKQLREEAFPRLIENRFGEAYQKQLIEAFEKNLNRQ